MPGSCLAKQTKHYFPLYKRPKVGSKIQNQHCYREMHHSDHTQMREEVLGDGEERLALPPQPGLLLQGQGGAQDATDDPVQQCGKNVSVTKEREHQERKSFEFEGRKGRGILHCQGISRISRVSGILTTSTSARHEFYGLVTSTQSFENCSIWDSGIARLNCYKFNYVEWLFIR